MAKSPYPSLPEPLPFLGVLAIAGPDALGFLQGQLTNDVRLLADGRTQLAALNTPQGRVIALLRLRLGDDGTVYALLPDELLEPVQAVLRRFVLRSKVQVRIASELRVAWTRAGVESDCATGAPPPSDSAAASSVAERPGPQAVVFDYAPGRRVLACPEAVQVEAPVRAPAQAGDDVVPIDASENALDAWNALDISDGLPQVFAASSGAFVPQMLNLDLLDAISFTKGCYTGQEIVARTQHLGRIKRRLLGYRAGPGDAPAPLSGLFLDGTKVAEVLMSASLDDGVRLLAVTSLDAQDKPLQTADGRAAEPVDLPYAVAADKAGQA
jgi:tRNA-modifying protein YgfZ